MSVPAQPTTLASLVIDAVPGSAKERYAGFEALGQAAQQWLDDAAASCPSAVDPRLLEPHRFLPYVAARLPADVEPSAAVATVRAGDLFLAWACVQGDASAIRCFHDDFLQRLDGPLRRLDSTTGLAEEVRDRLAQELLVGSDDRPPRLAEYAGRGDLWSWLRISALRAAIKLRRRAAREVAVEQSMLDALAGAPDDAGVTPVTDPELTALKGRFTDNFKDAFEGAFADLSVRERNVLAQFHLDGLTTDQLGALYRVHRVTVSRWLSRARGTLLTGTRASLMRRLDLTPSECDSVIRIVQSQLDLTLERIIAPARPADGG
ncbi:MAG: sigma-70 family RNA polymerase sigma factor [Myxococcota bacterium]